MNQADQDQNTAAPKARSPRRRVVLIVSVLLLILIAGLTVAVGVAYWMWEQVPGYWTAQQQYRSETTPAERDRLARELENRVPDQLTYAGAIQVDAPPLRTRRIRLSFNEINAWLDQRFDDWLANQNVDMPRGIEQPMVTSEAGHLVLAFRVNTEEMDQVVSLVWSVHVRDDGQARLIVHGVRSGTLPLPKDSVIQRIIEYAKDQAGDDHPDAVTALRELLAGEPFEPRYQIDAREARLLNVDVDDEGVELHVRVARPRAADRETAGDAAG